jgi:phosphate-selective porin OprO/OprP
MKPLSFAILFLALGLVALRPVRAASVEEELAELRQRIDAVEVENQALRHGSSAPVAAQEGPLLTPDAYPADITGSVIESQISELESELAGSYADCPPYFDRTNDLGMSASWNHGLELTTADKDFRVHVGGRTQFDVGWFAAPENVQDNINEPYRDGADFRRGRLRIDGTMYRTIDWAVEYDFFNSFDDDGDSRTVTGPTDLWWTFREVPWVGNVRIGNQKPAIGFEHIVSSRFLPFMERSYNQDTFYGGSSNGFVPGISFFDNWGASDLGTWNLGVFKPVNGVFGSALGDDDFAVVSRLTRLAWYEYGGASLLHFGGSVLVEAPADGQITFRTRDAIRTGLSVDWPIPATTGDLAGDVLQWFNGELVAVNGPWTLQSEYLVSVYDDAAAIVSGVVQPSVGTAVYHGGYMQLLLFLTGEHDNYNKKTGVFERMIPHRNVYFRRGFVASGPGAWQIGARYNFLDLNDATLDGGILHNVTCGLNWFWNPNFKIQFNYMATHRDAPLAGDLGDGWINGWGVRLAHDF